MDEDERTPGANVIMGIVVTIVVSLGIVVFGAVLLAGLCGMG